MSYLNMYARVQVGEVVFENINSITITESVKEISDTAVVELPRNYKKLNGKPLLSYVYPGAYVRIETGYNGDFETDFAGYVKAGISADYPIVIECDKLYYLRQNNHVLSYEDVSLKELLYKIAPGYKIECPDVQLGKLAIDNASSVKMFNWLRDKWGLFIRVVDESIYAGWPFDFKPGFTKTHEYILGSNTKSMANLKFETEPDYNLQVNVNIHQKDGTIKRVKANELKDDQAKVIRLDAYNISEVAAKQMALAHQKQISYNGYSGMIKGFGFPRVHAGDNVTIIDPFALDRKGTYVTEKMVLEFAEAHIERSSYLSFKA